MASELRVDKIVPVDGVPTGGGGGVIQVVTATKTDAFTTTTVVNSTSDVTGLSINITPKFATSKIMICSMISAFVAKTSSYNAMGLLFLMKNSTRLASTVMKCRIDNSLSKVYLLMPGIDLIDSILFFPSLMNIGRIRSLLDILVSETRFRSHFDFLNLLNLVFGYEPTIFM